METSVDVQSLIKILQTIIPIAATARIVYCLIVMQLSEDEAPSLKKRIRNAIVFTVLTECISGLLTLVMGYF